MIFAVNIPAQTVEAGQALTFSATRIRSRRVTIASDSTGRFLTLFPGIYEVTFAGNVATPADGTAGAVSLAVAVNGAELPGSKATATTAAVSEPVSLTRTVPVQSFPYGGALAITIINPGTTAIEVTDASIYIKREA